MITRAQLHEHLDQVEDLRQELERTQERLSLETARAEGIKRELAILRVRATDEARKAQLALSGVSDKYGINAARAKVMLGALLELVKP